MHKYSDSNSNKCDTQSLDDHHLVANTPDWTGPSLSGNAVFLHPRRRRRSRRWRRWWWGKIWYLCRRWDTRIFLDKKFASLSQNKLPPPPPLLAQQVVRAKVELRSHTVRCAVSLIKIYLVVLETQCSYSPAFAWLSQWLWDGSFWIGQLEMEGGREAKIGTGLSA